jgi:hypothetical protein
MQTIQIQSGVAFLIQLTLNYTTTPVIQVDLTGLTVLISVKELTDTGTDDSAALIKSTITEHSDPINGTTTWRLSSSDTNILAKTYKADVRILKSGSEFVNSDTFNVVVVDVVTKRTV